MNGKETITAQLTEQKAKEKAFDSCASAVAMLALMPVFIACKGYILCQLWAWFVVPRFGLEPLTLPAAIGLALLVNMLTLRRTASNDDAPIKFGRTIAFFVLDCVWFLGLGWVVHTFI